MADDKTIVKQLRLMIDHRDESTFPNIEDWVAAVKEALEPLGHVTTTGHNYLILKPSEGYGKVCRPEDFDLEARDFKEGKTPPSWAGGPHKLDELGNKIPIEGAPPKYVPTGPLPKDGRKGRGATTTRPSSRAVSTQVDDDDEDMIDLADLAVDVKSAESEAESRAESVAGSAAKKFRLKKSSNKK